MTDSERPSDTPSGTAPPGFYPVGPGPRRFWDGQAWTDRFEEAPAVGDERTMAMLSHLLALFASILGPLLIYLIKKDESAYVRHHAAQALNFSITVFLASVVAAVSTLLLIGFLLLPVILVGAFVFHVVAAVAANKGEWYRYPFSIPFVT